MKNRLLKTESIGVVFVLILGTIMHFVFEWTGYNPVIGAVVPVNESVWEHLKILFFPMLLFTIAEYLLLPKFRNRLFTVRLISAVIGLFYIVSFFYTYSGILGKSILFLDIFSFVTGVILMYLISYLLFKVSVLSNKAANIICLVLLLAIAALFIIFTFETPGLPLFHVVH